MSDTVTPELEAVAKAICRANLLNTFQGMDTTLSEDVLVDSEWMSFLPEARAALTAIREPTERMIKASASSDAAFDGREFSAMGRADRERYCSRCKLSHTAVIDYITGEER